MKVFFYRSDVIGSISVRQIDILLRIWESMAQDVKVPGNHTQKRDVDRKEKKQCAEDAYGYKVR